MRKPMRSSRAFQDVVTDDDLARLIHAMNAPSSEVFHRQVCADPGCACYGPGWSGKILAEVWHQMPHSTPDVAPFVGWSESATTSHEPLRALEPLSPRKLNR